MCVMFKQQEEGYHGQRPTFKRSAGYDKVSGSDLEDFRNLIEC